MKEIRKLDEVLKAMEICGLRYRSRGEVNDE